MSHAVSLGYGGRGSRLQIKGGERACSRFCRVKCHYIKSSISICGPVLPVRPFCDLWSLLLRESKQCSRPRWAVRSSICGAQLCLDNNTHQMVITHTDQDPTLPKPGAQNLSEALAAPAERPRLLLIKRLKLMPGRTQK